MVAADFLYYSIGIGFLVLVGFVSYTVFTLSVTLKELTSILVKVNDIAKDANELKNIIKSGIVYLKSLVFRKAGDKNGSK